MHGHPSKQILERLLAETLTDKERDSVAAHLETCSECQNALHHLTADDPASSSISPMSASNPIPQSIGAELDTFVQRLRRIPAPGSGPAASELDGAENGGVPPLQLPGYEILEELGRGASGVVYRARDRALNRLVALKVIHAGPRLPDVVRQRFLEEAKTIARLKHPNIVQIYAVGEHAGCPFLCLELVEGGNLADRMNGKPQSVPDCVRIIASLSRAIGYAHGDGVVHRDLKPANVLFKGARDGADKLEIMVTDFGIAKVLPDQGIAEAGMTQTNEILGTPAYMAPEQASGKAKQICPATDVYAIGAILYELLTGRPPFQGANSLDTLVQAMWQDPVPVRLLVPRVPRDLETICLKCLEKDSKRRYANCAALAEDLHRYQSGEPVSARPLTRITEAVRWIRRHPMQTVLIAGGIATCVGLIGGAFWLISANAERSKVVDGDLREVSAMEEAGSWSQANTALVRARIELGSHGPQALRDRLKTCERELALVARLDQLQMNYSRSYRGDLNLNRSVSDFADALRDAGLGSLNDDPALVAQRIRQSPVRIPLLNALHLVLVRAPTPWYLAVARKAEPDPAGWRDQALDLSVWNKPAELKHLLDTVKVDEQPATLLLAVAMRCAGWGEKPGSFLERLQAQYPDDFWTNLELGQLHLEQNQLADAIRYLQAAVSVRPSAAVAEDNLAMALVHSGNLQKAIEHYRIEIRLDPTNAVGHNNLGLYLNNSGNHAEALGEAKVAVALTPDEPRCHTTLAGCYRANGRKADALVEYEKAFALAPQNQANFEGLNACLDQPLSAEQRCIKWGGLVDANPPQYQAWDGYAEFCLFLDQQEKYRKARTDLLRQFGNTTDPLTAQLVGRACLLFPASEEETRMAVALIDRAMSSDPSSMRLPVYLSFFNVAKALGDYRQGKYQSAVDRLQGANASVLSTMRLLILAMARHQLGEASEAKRLLNQAVGSTDWSLPKATDADVWIRHTLRREAEELLAARSEEKQ
jgi:serine/threonine-protein kinase